MNFPEYLSYLNSDHIPREYQEVIDMTGCEGVDHSKGRRYKIRLPFPSQVARGHVEGFREKEKPQEHDIFAKYKKKKKA